MYKGERCQETSIPHEASTMASLVRLTIVSSLVQHLCSKHFYARSLHTVRKPNPTILLFVTTNKPAFEPQITHEWLIC
jgi:hypothetical protein